MEREQSIESLAALGISILLFFFILFVVVIIIQRRRLYLKRILSRQLENECLAEIKKLETKFEVISSQLDEIKKTSN